MKILKSLPLFLLAFAGTLGFSQGSFAAESESYTFTLPAGQSVWQSETIKSAQAFDFAAFETDSFLDHLDLQMKMQEAGVETWRDVDLHNEYGEGLESMMTTGPLNALELRYQGDALKAPIQITAHLFPVQKNQGLVSTSVKPVSLEMGGNENIPIIIPRSAWGADESLRFVDQGSGSGADPCQDLVDQYPQDFEISYSQEYSGSEKEPYWPEKYSAKVEHLIVHHTTTANLDVESPAIVRSIYKYHTLTRGWGDIGYNYLIDPDGNIYEGRYGGEHNGLPVVAGHARCSNRNTIGIALIGNYQENSVPGPMLDSLSDLTAYFSDKYQLDPLSQSLWHGEMKYTIAGHRDFQSTACPGQYMYDLLPKLREATDLKLQSNYSVNFDPKNLPYNAQAVLKEKVLSLNPNERQTLTVEFKNTGTEAWGNQTWLYGVASTQQIAIPLVADKPFVLANLDQSQVAPGAVGTFKVKLQAPFQAGEHVVYMVPVVDNKVKISRAAMTLKLTVQEPVLTYQLLEQKLPSGEVKAGTELKDGLGNWFSVRLKNTGNTTWLKENTGLYASGPRERSSLFSNGPLMANLTQAQVPPGEAGEFVFQNLKAPTLQSGEVVEQFTPLIQEANGTKHWLPDQALGFKVSILGSSPGLLSANLLDALPASKATDDLFRVKLSYSPGLEEASVVTSAQPFYLQNTKGGPYLEMPAGATVNLKQWKNILSLNTSTKQKALVGGLRVIPSEGGILEIRSWEHRPTWNLELNDNQFRGNLEFRVDKNSNQLVTINELPLEDYLKGIAEVSNNDPVEKQKTMAVIARSYAEFYRQPENRKFPNEPYDGSDDPNVFQKYLGYGLEKRSPNFVKAVAQTAGQVVKYNGKVVKTPYFNESAGRTLSAQEVWGWTDTPYLKSVDDSSCKGGKGTQSGHGVGLSGCGATAMAEAGKGFMEIIKYYYTGVEVAKI